MSMKESDAVIRLLGSADVDAFRRIRLEALREEPASFASSIEEWEALDVAEWRQRLEANAIFVAFHGSEPIGIMGLMRQRAGKMAHRATIIMVYVRNEHRGAGIASRLLNGLTRHAGKMGIRQLELAVTGDNIPALRFYKREGFAEVGCFPGGYLHDEREIDEILMTRRV